MYVRELHTRKTSDALSARGKSIYPKDCRAVFSTAACSVCLPSDGLAKEVAAMLVPSVGRTALRCTISLTVDDLSRF